MRHALVGPSAYLFEQLAKYAILGATHVSIMPGPDGATSGRTLGSLGTEILPALRG
jgi:hypothetical protein